LSVYVDTSALLALLDADDLRHERAAGFFADSLRAGTDLITSNYVVVEACGIVQRRLGMPSLRALVDRHLRVLTVEWVDEPVHAAGLTALLSANRRGLSLVDCVSFEIMRDHGITACFAFDRHFAEQGFEVLPPA
jgi:predicted nucleic acid-binding protein